MLDPRALPEQFGRYRIVRPLGKGGMGAVYLAHDPQLDREVALKVPFLSDGDPELRERFVREARAAATVRHPNICPVYDIDECDGLLYLTMAYVPGRALSDVIAKGKAIPERQAALLVRKVARGLEAAHEKGIVHRDLKPSNLMLDERNEPIVMDFGLARPVSADSAKLTSAGELVGTPAYMSPEQVKGEPGGIGPATDIYSLGVVLYELLTGRLPFEGNIAAVLSQILLKEPVRPSELRPDLDAELEGICLKAMAKEPGERFGSMKEFADALVEWARNRSGGTPVVGSVATPAGTIAMGPAAAGVRGTLISAVRVAGVLGAIALAGMGLVMMMQEDAAVEAPPGAVVAEGSSEELDEEMLQFLELMEEPDDAVVAGEPVGTTSEAGWISLLNGKDMTGWRTASITKTKKIPEYGVWEWREGALVRVGGGVGATTHGAIFGDLELEMEIKFPADGSVMLNLRNTGPRSGIPVPLRTDPMERESRSGRADAAYFRRFHDVPNRLDPETWHAIAIRCVGDDFRLKIDGDEVVKLELIDFKIPKEAERRGRISLLTFDNSVGVAIRSLRAREVRGE